MASRSLGDLFPAKVVQRRWHLFDATAQPVGRLAVRIATILIGKHKPTYHRSTDVGDYVVVLNSKHVAFTGKKWQNKLYRKHSGFPGGLKETPAHRLHEKHPDAVLRKAVHGMIHHNKHKIERMARLKIYPGVEHPHQAQLNLPQQIIESLRHAG